MLFVGVLAGLFLASPLVMVLSVVLAFVVAAVRSHYEMKRWKKEKPIIEKKIEEYYQKCIDKEAEIWYNAFQKLENGSRVENKG